MEKRHFFLAMLLFCSAFANAQGLLDRIIDTALVREQHESVLLKLDSARCFPHKNISLDNKNCIVCEVYNCQRSLYYLVILLFCHEKRSILLYRCH